MTVQATAEAALLAAIATQLPTVQINPADPGEDKRLKESIWVESVESEFEWRSLGRPATHGTRNRTELIRIELVVHVYREGADQIVTAAAAKTRAGEILVEIEQALEADFSLASTVTHALVTRWLTRPVAQGQGWAIDGRVTVEATNHPT